MNALCAHRMDISLCMILPHGVTLMARIFARNDFHIERLEEMKKDIGNQLPCLKVEMWKRVCEVW